jgi:hypothetical protein
MKRTECIASFKLWTSQRTWFWSLIYPDREGGAIGAATSKAKALHDVHAAIERLRHQRDTVVTLVAPFEDSKLIRGCRSSKGSQFHFGGRRAAANGKLASSSAAPKRRAKMPALTRSYSDLWQLTLHQYAARVAYA